MLLRLATPDDIPAIVAIERTPMAREFVGQWSEERHRATLVGGDARYYVSETESGEVQAYAILRGIKRTPAPSNSSESSSRYPNADSAAAFSEN